jgi:hypothetical protein
MNFLKQAQAINNTINAESEIYKKVLTEVGIQASDLNQYLFLDSLKEKKDANVLVGLGNSIINLGGNNAIPQPRANQ